MDESGTNCANFEPFKGAGRGDWGKPDRHGHLSGRGGLSAHFGWAAVGPESGAEDCEHMPGRAGGRGPGWKQGLFERTDPGAFVHGAGVWAVCAVCQRVFARRADGGGNGAGRADWRAERGAGGQSEAEKTCRKAAQGAL